MTSLDLGVIGNSNVAALIDRAGRIVWTSWPRIDGDPVFCSLLDGEDPDGGYFSFEFDEETVATEQSYERNTAILRTVHRSASGAAFAVTDFSPRFRQFGRMHRPPMVIRRVDRLEGLCRIRARIRPRMDYGRYRALPIAGSNHIRYVSEAGSIRLTTDAPLALVAGEGAFVLSRPMTFIIHADESLPDSTSRIAREFHDLTREYWLDWVRQLSIPFEWQEAVIRAAITLKLCSFEDTGAIVAALTTSIPEAPESGRNWDYRYCWLRDAYFTVHALNRLSATRTTERFIDYVTNVVAMEQGQLLRPVYAILPEQPIEEQVIQSLSGFNGHGPVRIGNAAADQIQHDVYGSVVLAASPLFFDERLPRKGDESLYAMLEQLGRTAIDQSLQPDAGIWEFRGRTRVHTYSATMCWAACDRLSRIGRSLGLQESAASWRRSADGLRENILRRGWNADRKSFVDSLDGQDIDASVLLLHKLGIIEATDPRFVSTVDTLSQFLGRGGHLLRYSAADDFGEPSMSFTMCTLWYVEAIAAIGRVAEARQIFESVLACRNHVGLLSEDLDPATGRLWGNFPQTYSMVGIVLTAMRLSKAWEAT
jgi:GH15 family glucan-1,4-alpha-glucosidase